MKSDQFPYQKKPAAFNLRFQAMHTFPALFKKQCWLKGRFGSTGACARSVYKATVIKKGFYCDKKGGLP